MPLVVTIGSPRRTCTSFVFASRTCTAVFLSGTPANRSTMTFDQAMVTPLFAGASATTSIPRSPTACCHEPSEETRGQLAPPRARNAASKLTSVSSPAISNAKRSSPLHPIHRAPRRSSTPSESRCPSQERRSGTARICLGNTRPLEPTKVSWPRPAHQFRSSSGGNARIAGSRCRRSGPYRSSKASRGSLWVMLSPPRPANTNLRAGDRR